MSIWYGPQRARTLKRNRRMSEMVRTTDERDIGIRRVAEAAFCFGDPRAFPGSVERFRWLAHIRLTSHGS